MKQLVQQEAKVMSVLQWRLSPPSALKLLHKFIHLAQVCDKAGQLTSIWFLVLSHICRSTDTHIDTYSDCASGQSMPFSNTVGKHLHQLPYTYLTPPPFCRLQINSRTVQALAECMLLLAAHDVQHCAQARPSQARGVHTPAVAEQKWLATCYRHWLQACHHS